MDKRFIELTRRYWTDERLRKVTGDKKLLLLPPDAPLLLHSMGLLNADGSMAARCVSKYRQINHMLTLLLPEIELLTGRYAQLHILDGCCGNSFVSLLLAWLLREKLKVDFRLVGIDRQPSVVQASQERADRMGWGSSVKFVAGNIALNMWNNVVPRLFDETPSKMLRPHVVIALHACDTATDDVLAIGVQLQADLLAVAPCCQAELARGWKNRECDLHPLKDLHQNPNLRRDAAATITDAMRLALLRGMGYEVKSLEFVPSDHTPKNRLLICRTGGNALDHSQKNYAAIKAATGGIGIGLAENLATIGQPVRKYSSTNA